MGEIEEGGETEEFVKEIGQITFYLAREGLAFDQMIDLDATESQKTAVRSIDFTVDETKCRFVYFETISHRKNPPWLDFVNERLDRGEPFAFSDTSNSPNGILLTEIEGRVLAAAFGRSAASCLPRKELVPDFGIKTAMNMCGNEEIRQTRSQSNALTPTHIDRQASRPSDTFVFGLSDAEDLRYISAHIKGDRTVTLQGRDHLTVKVIGKEKLSWARLLERCRRFLERYDAKDYAELFPNYRNLQPATDEEAAELNTRLVAALQARDVAKIDLCIPEFLSEDDYSFAYTSYATRENMIYAFLAPSQLEKVFPDPDDISIEHLEGRRIYPYSAADGRVLKHRWWSIYECLVFEQEIDGQYFVLSAGRWSKVDREFYKKIIDFIAEKVKLEDAEAWCCGIDISDDVTMRNNEGAFNVKIVELKPSCVLFDRAKLKIGTGLKNKEFCDVLDLCDDGHIRIINVKQHKDASSINYLFSQAKFYCEAFLNDEVFVGEIRGHIEASGSTRKADYLELIKADIAENHGKDYTLCLWLLYDAKEATPTKDDIPLIAKYELKLMHDHLRKVCKFQDIVLRFIPVGVKRYTKSKKNKAA